MLVSKNMDVVLARWTCPSWQARIVPQKSCIIVLRVMRDLCNRVHTWKPLQGWVNTTPLWTLTVHILQSLIYQLISKWAKKIIIVSQVIELLCDKAILSSIRPLGVAEALRRVFECLAAGMLHKGMRFSMLMLKLSRWVIAKIMHYMYTTLWLFQCKWIPALTSFPYYKLPDLSG